MRVLVLAPQPFFQERGTPIAVRLLLEVLAAEGQHSLDVLVYHEGEEIELQGVTIHRTPVPPFIRGVRPGVSFKKLICDLFFTIEAFRLVWRTRNNPYTIVHAVEEGVFVAWALKRLCGTPFLYDMDSSLALQVAEKWPWFKVLTPIFRFLERHAVRESMAVVPVCDALAAIAEAHGSAHTQVLSDVSLLTSPDGGGAADLCGELGVPAGTPIVLYVGNLERYQGVDLLLHAFKEAAAAHPSAALAVIGGAEKDLVHYRALSDALGLNGRAFFIGPRPMKRLGSYLAAADVLASPRVQGNNTPMKLYSYLHSGRAIVATDLPTHTQVLDGEVAVLAAPEPQAFGAAISELLGSPELRSRLGAAAQARAAERYTFAVFRRTLLSLYEKLNGDLQARAELGGVRSRPAALTD